MENASVVAILVISVVIHEVCHGLVALRCGDTTARDLGRLTLNPIVHVDPFMTIILPAVLYWVSHGTFVFGGAKPVPVNFYNLKKPYRDMALVALAGPVSNFLLAVVLFLLFKVTVLDMHFFPERSLGANVLVQGVALNLLLAVFNIVPIPPLDGSRIMTWLLPSGLRESYMRMERFGILILVALLLYVPAFNAFLIQSLNGMWNFVETLVTLGGRW